MPVPQMATYSLYYPSFLSPSRTRLYIQETRVALLPIRSLLLYHNPEFYVHLAGSIKLDTLDRVLLSLSWLIGERRYYMEKQPCLPWLGQSDFIVRTYLRATSLYSHSVRCKLVILHYSNSPDQLSSGTFILVQRRVFQLFPKCHI